MATARDRAREADLLRFGLAEVEAVAPEPGEDVALAAEESRLGFADTLRTAAEQAREALSSDEGAARRAGGHRHGPHACSTACATTTPEAGELADRLAEVTYLLSDVAADVASYASGIDTDPARLAAVSERRAALTALTRKYGETHRRGARLGRGRRTAPPRPRRHRRADRASCAPSATACAAELGDAAEHCPPPGSRRPAARRRRSPTS